MLSRPIGCLVRRWLLVLLTVLFAAREASALQTTFEAGSLIIPMDNGPADGQTNPLRAYGLVYELLRAGVPVHWAINPAKSPNGDDFVIAPATPWLEDLRTGDEIASHDYRGGPFIVADTDAAAALPIMEAWQAGEAALVNKTAVHVLTSGSLDMIEIARRLVAAPRIAILKDGNETTAFNDLNAAGIRDASGGAWSASSPDQLTEAEVVGLTTTSDEDGALLHLPSGVPRYCHFIAMHYDLSATTQATVDEVGREVRSWLDRGPLTGAFMQCDAAEVFENSAGGDYLTVSGIADDGAAPASSTIRVPSHPLVQVDGAFSADIGSFAALRAVGDTFNTSAQILVNETSAVLTRRIVLLAGRLDGDPLTGKVTYLAGHDYSTQLPIATNPQTNGVRMLLNAIFDADCAVTENPDDVLLSKSGPTVISGSSITYTIGYSNDGSLPLENVTLVDTLPPGTSFVAASDGGTEASGVVTWQLPALAGGASGSRTLTVSVAADGDYTNAAELRFSGQTVRTVVSNAVTTTRDSIPPVVTIPGPPTNPTVTANSLPSFFFTVSTGGTPVTSFCSLYSGVTQVRVPTPCNSGVYNVPSPALADGAYRFEVVATDEAGNTGADEFAFVVDTSAPESTPTVTIEPTATATPTPTSTPTATATTTPTATSTPAPASACGGGPFPGCKAPGVTVLTLRNYADDRRDNLKLTLARGAATTLAELGDPTVDTNYTLCVWDWVGGTPSLVMEMTAPAGGNCSGRPCWRPIASGGYRYVDPGLLPNGLQKLTLRSGPLGKSTVYARARGVVLADPPMPFQHDPLITAQLVNGIGTCWGADYVNAPRANSAAKLLLKERP